MIFDMKRIAIITPCLLPVPASNGGAVEGLITRIINDNEVYKEYIIDLFAIVGVSGCNSTYLCTEIIKIESTLFSKVADRLLDKYYRTFSKTCSRRVLDEIVLKSFAERLKEIQDVYDAVIVENIMSTAIEVVRFCQGEYDFPVFFHMHNDVDIYRSPEQIRELVRDGVQFLVVSDYIKGQIFRNRENAVASTLHNGIDLSRYTKAEGAKLVNKDLSLLYAGRIIPGKGVKELLLSFIQMLRKNNNTDRIIKLTIAGFSGFDRNYEKEIRKLAGAHKNISCMDQVSSEEMPALYDKADIVVMPTKDEEAFGLVALEAMAKGIPLIVTNSGELPRLVEDGACIVDKSKDLVDNLSKALEKVVFNDEYRAELSKLAYKRAHGTDSFSIDNYYHNFVQLINGDKMTDKDIISIIVPVYNVAAYLQRCVASITSQTYGNIEILIIDDGSTDGSSDICDRLAASDCRIKVIHQENLGLSVARNTGLANASGRYIFFCDSDDYLQGEALERMLLKLKKDNADVICCGIENVYESGIGNERPEELITNLRPGRWSGPESVVQMMRGSNVCSIICNKLIKKELFDGVRFPSGVKNEDEATTYKVLYKAKIVTYIPDRYYKYFQREKSIMHEDLAYRYSFFLDALTDRMKYFSALGEHDLEQHSRISLLEWIKYSYRRIDDAEIRRELVNTYQDNISFRNAPVVMGRKKQMALLLWKYLRY